MKKMHKQVMVLGAFVSICSCSTPAFVERAPNINLSDLKTYMWVKTMASENDSAARTYAFADLTVHNAVNAELQGGAGKKLRKSWMYS